jgi:hypothetical protein
MYVSPVSMSSSHLQLATYFRSIQITERTLIMYVMDGLRKGLQVPSQK